MANAELKKFSDTIDKQEKLKIGKFEICFIDGTEKNGIWVQDIKTREGGQFRGEILEKAIEMLWKDL